MKKARRQYQPLQNNDTIKILTLDQGQQGDPLTGTLKPVPIKSAGSYEVVLYVWADPEPSNSACNILIHDGDDNEGLFAMRGGSIFAALRRLRLPDQPHRIWADQCCSSLDRSRMKDLEDVRIVPQFLEIFQSTDLGSGKLLYGTT